MTFEAAPKLRLIMLLQKWAQDCICDWKGSCSFARQSRTARL